MLRLKNTKEKTDDAKHKKSDKKTWSIEKVPWNQKGETIPASKLRAAAKKPGKLGQRARFAVTLGKLRKK